MSLVAQVNPAHMTEVQDKLLNIEAVEILDIVADNTKILLLLDSENEEIFNQSLASIQDISLIQSISYAAHYTENAVSSTS